MPSTSACATPSWSSSPVSIGARGGQVVGHHRGRGLADAGHVKPDDAPARVQRVDERLEQLQAAADPVAM
jgi:hypothetical protein